MACVIFSNLNELDDGMVPFGLNVRVHPSPHAIDGWVEGHYNDEDQLWLTGKQGQIPMQRVNSYFVPFILCTMDFL